jgi:hypothetical protein
VGSLLSIIYFDTNGNGLFGDSGDAVTTTSYTGEFGRGFTVIEPALVSGTLPSGPTLRMNALGIDSVTGFVFSHMTAPVGATVISPLSSLIDAQGSEANVRAALALDSGGDALTTQINLLTFNPALNRANTETGAARDAARLTSVNLQLLALASVLKDTNGDPVDYVAPLDKSSAYLAQFITATGSLKLSDSGVIRSLLEKSRAGEIMTSGQLDATASLLAKYMAAIPPHIFTESDARAWAYAFRFYVFPEFRILTSTWPNSASARVDAIQPADIAAAAADFRTAPSPVTGKLMAAPDYRELVSNSASPYSLTMSDCSVLAALPTCNDWTHLAASPGTLISIQSSNPNSIAVNLTAGTVRITRIGTFTGLAEITYTSSSDNGDTTTGIIYVRVRPPA